MHSADEKKGPGNPPRPHCHHLALLTLFGVLPDRPALARQPRIATTSHITASEFLPPLREIVQSVAARCDYPMAFATPASTLRCRLWFNDYTSSSLSCRIFLASFSLIRLPIWMFG